MIYAVVYSPRHRFACRPSLLRKEGFSFLSFGEGWGEADKATRYYAFN